MDKKSLLQYNRQAWNEQVAKKNRWTLPVTPDEIKRARNGDWNIVLTPTKPVSREWFPDFKDQESKVLCLAGSGGQQTPILAAAGASVTAFDNSESQLAQDRMVAERENLKIETVQGDMADLSCFDDESFDMIFHPCSNTFVPDIRPVWNEAYRVLKHGGSMLSGFTNPVRFIFDDPLLEKGKMKVAHKIPYSDLTSISDQQRQKYTDEMEPLCFGHTLTDQIAGQTDVGFRIAGFFEDVYETDDVLSDYIATFIATRAVK